MHNSNSYPRYWLFISDGLDFSVSWSHPCSGLGAQEQPGMGWPGAATISAWLSAAIAGKGLSGPHPAADSMLAKGRIT